MKYTDLPKACPACRKPLSKYRRPARKMQTKAIVLFLIGIVVTMVWAFGLLLLLPLLPFVPAPDGPTDWSVFVTVIFAPGLVIGALALRIPKVVSLECSHCEWSDRFTIDNRGESAATNELAGIPGISRDAPPRRRRAAPVAEASAAIADHAPSSAPMSAALRARLDRERRLQNRARRFRRACLATFLIAAPAMVGSIYFAEKHGSQALFGLACFLFIPTLITGGILLLTGGFMPQRTTRR